MPRFLRRFGRLILRFGQWLLGTRGMTQDAQHLADTACTVVKAHRTETPPPAEGSESEAFAQAVQEYGRSETDLKNLHRYHTVRVYALTAGALFTLAYSLTTAFLTYGAGIGGLAVLLALLFLAGAAQSSLRAWQLRERRLGSFSEWLRQPRVWFPFLFS